MARLDPSHRRSSHHRGFTLLEVIVALGILVVSLALLVEIQASAAVATREAERMVTATQLAQEKLTEVEIYLEQEGISESEVHEEGDFDELGDEQFDLEFGEGLEDYHWEWWVSEIDIGLAGDLATMAEELGGLDVGGAGEASSDGPEDQAPDLNSLGISNEMITDMLSRYIREVRVRVWWGEDSKEAEERHDEVIIISHATDPAGSFINMEQGDMGAGK